MGSCSLQSANHERAKELVSFDPRDDSERGINPWHAQLAPGFLPSAAAIQRCGYKLCEAEWFVVVYYVRVG